MKYLFAIVMTFLLMVSCQQQNKSSKEKTDPVILTLEKEVMALHDEVMPKMNEMHKFEKSLRRKARSTPETADVCKSVANELHVADSLMWDWMYAYKNPIQLLDSLDSERVIEYLKKEKVRAGRVNTSIKEGMNKARELLADQ